jgi:hypothetical protein
MQNQLKVSMPVKPKAERARVLHVMDIYFHESNDEAPINITRKIEQCGMNLNGSKNGLGLPEPQTQTSSAK